MPENIIFFTQNNGGLPIIDPKFIVHLTRNATRKRGKYILVKDIYNELCILVSYCCPLSQFYFKSSYTHSWLLSPLHYPKPDMSMKTLLYIFTIFLPEKHHNGVSLHALVPFTGLQA